MLTFHGTPDSPGFDLRGIGADSERHALTSQLAVFRSCPEVMSRLLKNRSSVLLAARVLVISRLLHIKMSQHSTSPPYLESLKNRMTTLRHKLLVRIDESFKIPEISGDELVEAMCAFSLATSSSPTDVLRHFHHMRREATFEYIRKSSFGHSGITSALQLYVKTVKDSQALVPVQLARALERLKSVPLFENSDLFSLIELNLEMHEKWIGDDIKTFTPYIRQDDLQRSVAESLLRSWSKQAFAGLLYHLKDRIEEIDEPSIIVQLRRQTIEIWFSNSWHSSGIDPNEALDSFRDVFNGQLIWLVQSRVSSLAGITSAIKSALDNLTINAGDRDLSLWATSMVSMDISRGADSFRDTLLTTIKGQNSILKKIAAQYDEWLARISAIEATIKILQSEVWDIDLDDTDDGDGDSSKQSLLSSDDPAAIQTELSKSLRSSFSSLETSLEALLSTTDEHNYGYVSTYLLRISKELRENLPSSCEDVEFGLRLLPKLHKILANAALDSPWQKCRRRMQTVNVAGRQLWEGNPELPVLPSPWAFRFLKDLSSSMSDFGTDVWSPSAVEVLKGSLCGNLALETNRPFGTPPVINGHSTDEINGNVDGNKITNGVSSPTSQVAPSTSRDFSIQRLFDSLYVMHAAAPKESRDSKETRTDDFDIQVAGIREAARVDKGYVERIERGAEEYWKRTALLFGLLD